MEVMAKPSFTATVQARGKKDAYSLEFCPLHGTARQTGLGRIVPEPPLYGLEEGQEKEKVLGQEKR